MQGYVKADTNPAQRAAKQTAEHRALTRAAAPAASTVNADASAQRLSPASRSLLQMREALDEGADVQSHLAMQRALNERAAQPVQTKPNATGLPDRLKAGVESLSGLAMDDVRVHYNSQKPAAVNAHAYAQGTEIHVAPGQAQHLPHEAWHVVQQKEGRVKPTLQMKGVAINDDTGLEREASMMGARATCHRPSDAPAPRSVQTIGGGGAPAPMQLFYEKTGTGVRWVDGPADPNHYGKTGETHKSEPVYVRKPPAATPGDATFAAQMPEFRSRFPKKTARKTSNAKPKLGKPPQSHQGSISPPPTPTSPARRIIEQQAASDETTAVVSADHKHDVSPHTASGMTEAIPVTPAIKGQDNEHQGSQGAQAGFVSHDQPPVSELPTHIKKTEVDPPIKSQAQQGNNINDPALNIADEKHGGSAGSLAATNNAAGQAQTSGNAGAAGTVAAVGRKALKPVVKKKKPRDLPATAKTATEDEYRKCVAKGAKLMKQLEEDLALQSSGAVAGSRDKGPSKEDFAAQYDTRVIPGSDKTYKEVRSDRRESEYINQYHNNVSTDGTQIHAETNRKDADVVEGGEEAFSNSDILFHHYRKVAPESKALNSVRRANVANPETRGIMQYIREHESRARREAESVLEFKNDSEHFLALLGTPNGSAVVHMLKDHAPSLGPKTIDNVAMMGDSLVINLKEYKS